MIRSFDEDEDIENSFNLVLRNKEYKTEIYKINEEIKHNKNMSKLYGYNKERNLNVVITKIMNISLKENKNFEKRLLITIKLIEENRLLVENLWIEKINSNNYTLYISELTNSIYRNEYNLITLNNYMNSTQNTYKENIEILISITEKMLYFNSINFSHLNIHPNNIYINTKKNNIIYFGPPKLVKKYTYDCTYLWYSGPEENYRQDEIWENNAYGYYNDIWSLGCIICEMFFINFPLFQSYSPNEKIMKIVEILGFPEFEEVDFMNKYQYDSLLKKSTNNSKENNLVGFLLSSKEEHSNLYNFKIELIDIINGCLGYNRINRITLDEILKKLEYLNSNISSEFQSKIMNTTIINSEESEYYKNTNNNNNYKIIQNINSIESEEDNYFENNRENDDENFYINQNMNINEINEYNSNYNSIDKNRKNNIYNNLYLISNSNNNNSKIKNNISLNDEIDNRAKKIIQHYEDDKENKKGSLEEKNNKELNYKYKNKNISKNINKEINEYEELQKSK